MRIARLKIDGFGPLRGEYRFHPGRVALVVDRNETGKSSLLAAIAAALYGLEADRRTYKVLTPLERWRPWDGGSYRVEMDLESEGETYTVKRDFERGTVEVWNERGLEVTASFREGKDEFPVGKKLLGLDAAEFEKCALVRQGELDLVVPGDERARRANTLQARLESAADTRGGDTSSAEAVQVLQAALRRYEAVEIEFAGTVENAISRLELKRDELATDLAALEHDRRLVAEPLAQLAELGAQEQAARAAVAALEAERRTLAATELQRRLGECRAAREALSALEAEAAALAPHAQLPAGIEAELGETLAKLEAARHDLEAREVRRGEERTRRRGEIEATLASLEPYEGCGPEDADRLVALAAELRRLAGEESRAREALAGLRDALGRRGFEPARVEELGRRLGELGEERQALLAGQSAVALAFQTRIAELEQARTASTEVLRQIDAVRAARKLPGWFLAALGVAAAAAGGVVLGLGGEFVVGTALVGGGLVLGLLGIVLAALGERARRGDRELALRQLSDANRQLNTLRTQRAESELGLEELAKSLGYRGAVDLMRDWNEYRRLQDESDPVQRAQEQLDQLELQRHGVLAEVRERLERAGGGPPDPAHLETVAAGIRHRGALRQSLGELEQSWSWVDEEKRLDEAAVVALEERAAGVLARAGLARDPARPWSEHVEELAGRAKSRARLALLTEELIPQAARRLVPEAEVADLESQLAALEAEAAASGVTLPPGAAPRPALELDREARHQREVVELVQRRRGDLRQQVDEVVRRAAAREPELLAEQARVEQGLERARRFKRGVELAVTTIQEVAQETHKRWAEFLTRRVGELLAGMGSQLENVRFGDDLDFSLGLPGGQRLTRGKALLQLSSGARDQLHLAVRLGLSEFLSKPGDPLPLLCDDVFANSDDERARAGMRLLVEQLAREHQVIVMTCHRHRHEHLASLDPDVWAAGVQWLELRPADG